MMIFNGVAAGVGGRGAISPEISPPVCFGGAFGCRPIIQMIINATMSELTAMFLYEIFSLRSAASRPLAAFAKPQIVQP